MVHGAGNTVVANIHLDMLQVFLFHTLVVLNRKKCFNRTVLHPISGMRYKVPSMSGLLISELKAVEPCCDLREVLFIFFLGGGGVERWGGEGGIYNTTPSCGARSRFT
jgi:hypothetical protein